ncbi:MAG TPA: M48 family metallopeptidase [Gemmataceae bacterium]|nr:M48 family metallopeptidase [Gemmataceae bacterium]
MRSDIRIVPILVGLLIVGGLLFKGCQEGPFGRKQLTLMSPEQEYNLGAQAFREVLRKSDVVSGGPVVNVVQRVGGRLASAAEDPELRKLFRVRGDARFGWEFKVVESTQVNAFCLPGGKVVVYTGILPVCRTEGGLAAVMGHEIGHALARHGAERMAQEQVVQIGQVAAAVSLSDMDFRKRAQIIGLLSAGTQVGLLSYSREHESEADHIGLLLMARAGYDPVEAVEFWQRMEQQGGGGRTPEFLSTHPSHGRRIQQLRGWLPEARQIYARSTHQPSRPLPLSR